MSFIWPVMFFLLLLIPIMVVLYFRLYSQRQRAVARFSSLGFAQGTQSKKFDVRRLIPQALFLLALTLLIIALARPQMDLSLPRVEGTVILAFDVSGSMAATDLKPTRMDAAKAAAQDFVAKQPASVQIGVVAFSDSGFSVQAPTNEKDAVLAAIYRLSPERGTSLASGILGSLNTISLGTAPVTHYYSNLTPTPELTPTPVPQGTFTSGVIVLLTDGENNERPDPLQAAQAAADRGVRIYTVGIGSTAGADLKINGFTVHTQLDEATLQQISQISGGLYYNAQSEQDLLKIYDNLNPQLITKPQETEVTSLFAGVSILILLIGATFSLLWFSRLP
jgi:Ca-activated chloride channel homolog